MLIKLSYLINSQLRLLIIVPDSDFSSFKMSVWWSRLKADHANLESNEGLLHSNKKVHRLLWHLFHSYVKGEFKVRLWLIIDTKNNLKLQTSIEITPPYLFMLGGLLSAEVWFFNGSNWLDGRGHQKTLSMPTYVTLNWPSHQGVQCDTLSHFSFIFHVESYMPLSKMCSSYFRMNWV